VPPGPPQGLGVSEARLPGAALPVRGRGGPTGRQPGRYPGRGRAPPAAHRSARSRTMSVVTEMPAAPASAAAPLAMDLMLVRLLRATKTPPRLPDVRNQLARFFGHQPTAEQWQEVIGQLRSDGLVEGKALRLTEAGRARALTFLEVSELPPRANWQTVQARL